MPTRKPSQPSKQPSCQVYWVNHISVNMPPQGAGSPKDAPAGVCSRGCRGCLAQESPWQGSHALTARLGTRATPGPPLTLRPCPSLPSAQAQCRVLTTAAGHNEVGIVLALVGQRAGTTDSPRPPGFCPRTPACTLLLLPGPIFCSHLAAHPAGGRTLNQSQIPSQEPELPRPCP